MKRAFVIHGWGGNPDEPMLAYCARELSMRGFEVHTPEMPHPDEPTIDDWVSALHDEVGIPDEHTFFVGHSVGTQTVLRYLETIPQDLQVGGVLLIAPWMILSIENLAEDESPDIAKPWMETPIDFKKVISHAKEFTAIFSDNDPFVPLLPNETLLKENLNVKIIILNNKGHFTEDDEVTDLPEVKLIFDNWK